MSQKRKPSSLSRRQFLKGVGSGVVGSMAASKVVKALPIEQLKEQLPPEGQVFIQLRVNGRNYALHVEPQSTLAEVLREHLKLTGTKIVCNHGECGACTVLLDGEAVYSCHMLAMDAQGKEITTIEGLLKGEELHPLQKAFVKKDGYQCGFCTPGQIMAARALIIKNPHPTKTEVLQAMSGNLCRCAAYPKIIDSVLEAAKEN